MKKLIVYFSRTGENSVNGKIEVVEKGFTEIVAEKIAKYTGAELYKLDPVEPYPYNYAACVQRSRSEGFVEYKNPKANLDEYDTIFLGFPNWWRSYPQIVATFLFRNKFEGKNIIPFCTNEEGAFGIGESELRAAAKGATIKPGFACRGHDADTCDEELKHWLMRVI